MSDTELIILQAGGPFRSIKQPTDWTYENGTTVSKNTIFGGIPSPQKPEDIHRWNRTQLKLITENETYTIFSYAGHDLPKGDENPVLGYWYLFPPQPDPKG